MTSLLLLILAACGLQRPPEIDRDQLSQWIDDAVMETVSHAKAENTERALEAWGAAQLHFETKMEPSLRYYGDQPREVTALEYQLGRLRDAVKSGEPETVEALAFTFLAELEEAVLVIPQKPVEALTH